MNTINICELTPEYWPSWKSLRLEALRQAPEAFGSSWEEESQWSDEQFQTGLKRGGIFGAFIQNELVGCIGYYRMDTLKTRHRGFVWGMYVKPAHRNQGIASQLLQFTMDLARSQVTQLHLTCVTTNENALRLYYKNGFQIYGTEPKSLKIGEHYFDEALMVQWF